ncbi:MAG: 6-phosphofructokinase [Pseudomonadota bacterium]|nr:6-phosphofructokinase [Pseudomonadota bacterium]
MNSQKIKNGFYAQSGGVTAVINASAYGVLKNARDNADKINKVFAGENGIIGALQENLIDTSLNSSQELEGLKTTPAGAFGSCRYKLGDLKNNLEKYQRIVEVLAAHDIGYFFYNGGGDSQDTTKNLADFLKEQAIDIKCIGIPKTIDNDLPETDCCPGFGSVAKYVATSILEASLDVASMARTSTKVFVLEVMGRHAGWIASSGGLAQKKQDDAPHIILFPEVPFQSNKFLQKVKDTVKRVGFCSIIVSEGVRQQNGDFLIENKGRDAFGHAQLGGAALYIARLIEKELKLKNHWAVADYLQRSARHIASKTDVEQAQAVGKHAVDLALMGKTSVMTTIKRMSNKPYTWGLDSVELEKVANREKMLPLEYITPDGFGITNQCREYLTPLIEGEDYPVYLNGIPTYTVLKRNLMQKKIKNNFSI